ncbi:hypothetical protein A9Q84_02045 [Halobacteriovorax marinus]|uniref:Lipoprotein n=1 Tax=Halobacteriovorax marinus TaxID=97084 RepID=A0A1Y5FCB1_9BACT|nr:hypothetical protein A9Q84_02045 [Halobacteriovorax marinus]
MKSSILVLLLSLVFVSCETIDGSLETFSDINLKGKRGKVTTLNEGVYSAKIKLKSKRKMKLVIGDDSFIFAIPRGTKFPTENGEIKLSSADVKQAYDVFGSIKTDVEHGSVRRDRESCSWDEPYTVCERNSDGEVTCRTEYRTRYGWKEVRYHIDIIDKRLSVELLAPGSDSIEGKFYGQERYAHKVYNYEGRCY